MSKAIIRLDNVSATHDGTLLKSVKLTKALQNGSVIAIKGLVTGEREIHETETPKASTTYFGILCTPELMYDEKKQMDEFENTLDKPARAFIPQTGDIFSATAEAFSTTPKIGQVVELATSEVMTVVDSATSGSTQIGSIIEIDVVGSKVFYVVEVM